MNLTNYPSKIAHDHYEIAVIVLTYNQENILQDCLKSILSQKLNSAKMKIYVIDDASTDETKSVIERFQIEYPNIVYPFYYETNQYQSGYAPEIPILKNIDASHIAFCDGDDFWIDELKLEKQINKFIRDASLSIVHTDFYLGRMSSSKIHFESRISKEIDKARKVKSSFDLIQGNDIKKSTALFRTSAIDFRFLSKCTGIRAQDWVIAISAGSNGGIEFLDDVTTCYRVSSNASFQSLDQNERLMIKDEVRWFCAANLPASDLRSEFRKFLMLQYCRSVVRDNPVYRRIRPFVEFCRYIKSVLQNSFHH